MNSFIFRMQDGWVSPAFHDNYWPCNHALEDVAEVEEVSYFYWPGFKVNKALTICLNGEKMLFLWNTEYGPAHYSDLETYNEIKFYCIEGEDEWSNHRYALLRRDQRWGIKHLYSAGDDPVECKENEPVKYESVEEALLSIGLNISTMKECPLEKSTISNDGINFSFEFGDGCYCMSASALSEKIKSGCCLKGINCHGENDSYDGLGGRTSKGFSYIKILMENHLCKRAFYLHSYSENGDPIYKAFASQFDTFYSISDSIQQPRALGFAYFENGSMYFTYFNYEILYREKKEVLMLTRNVVDNRLKSTNRDNWKDMNIVRSEFSMSKSRHEGLLVVTDWSQVYNGHVNNLLFDNNLVLTMRINYANYLDKTATISSIELGNVTLDSIILPTKYWINGRAFEITNVKK